VVGAADGTRLCLACGLCCDGSIFRAVPLQPDEMDEARRHRVTIIDKSQRRDAKDAMGQPCVLFRDGCCSTYGEWRPRACDAYRCGVLDDHVRGRRSLEASLEIVATFRAARDKLDGLDQPSGEGLDETTLRVDQKLALAVLKVLRHRYFTRERLGSGGAKS
jgi:uncharacterized protein